MSTIDKTDPNWLLQTWNAQEWAREFIRKAPNAADEGVMIGWFANAIMVGHDKGVSKGAADAVMQSSLVSSALEQLAPSVLLKASHSAYDHGLANGLLIALATLKGAEFCPVVVPSVYTCELATWGGRYRWLRAEKGLGRIRAAWLAIGSGGK